MKNIFPLSFFSVFLMLFAFADQAEAYYAPTTGRFINRDPIGEQGGANTYAFVRNSPVSHYDVLGLEGEASSEWPTKKILLIEGPDYQNWLGASSSHIKDISLPYKAKNVLWGDINKAIGPNKAVLRTLVKNYVKLWEEKNNKVCCVNFKSGAIAHSAKNLMTVENLKKILAGDHVKNADYVQLLFHGNYLPTDENNKKQPEKRVTGIVLHYGKAKMFGKTVGIGLPTELGSIIDPNGFPRDSIDIGCCFDGGLPDSVGDVTINKPAGGNRTSNIVTQALSGVKKFVHAQCDTNNAPK